MKRAFILPDLSIGGAQRVILNYAQQLSKDSQVILIVISSKGGLMEEIGDKVRLVAFSNDKLNIFLQIKFFFWLPYFVHREGVNTILSTLFQINIVLGILKYLRLLKAKLVLREANYVSKEWPKSRAYLLFRVLGRLAYRTSDAVVCLNEEQKADVHSFLNLSLQRIFIIPNPVITDEIVKAKSDDSQKMLHVEGPLVLSVGRLARQKRLDVLILAFKKFRDSTGKGTLVIVGQGMLERDLRVLVEKLGISDNVLFLGEILKPYQLFKLADLYVLSSDFEGLPNSLIQACYLTERVVSTNCRSGPSSILANYDGGFLVNVDDVSAMSEAMKIMLQRAKVPVSDSWVDRYSEVRSLEQLKLVLSCVE